MDDLGFEQAVDRLCQRVVVAVTDTANRGFDARVRQPFGVFDGQVLGSAVRMMDRAMVTPRVRVTMARPFPGGDVGEIARHCS